MFFLKFFFLVIAVVATVLSAQQIDSWEEMDLEAIEELPTDSSTTKDLDITDSYEDKVESTPDVPKIEERITESMSEITEAKEDNSKPIVGTTDSTSEKSESSEPIAIIFEEIEETSMNGQSYEMTTPSVIHTSTDSEDKIISEFNGLDANKSEKTFSCYGRAFGQYADIQKECRVFHLCYPYFNSTTDELLYQRISFLCDNDSVFDQKRFICVDNSTIEHKCSDSEALYLQTNQEYLIRVFSQSVSPIDEMKGEPNRGSDRNWMSWLYGH